MVGIQQHRREGSKRCCRGSLPNPQLLGLFPVLENQDESNGGWRERERERGEKRREEGEMERERFLIRVLGRWRNIMASHSWNATNEIGFYSVGVEVTGWLQISWFYWDPGCLSRIIENTGQGGNYFSHSTRYWLKADCTWQACC